MQTALEKSDPVTYKIFLNFCPEIRERKRPKDRTFFYNVLNTIKKGFVDNIVMNAVLAREKKQNIPNEIKVADYFRDMFTDPMSFIGRKGKVIREMREKHKPKPRRYKGRKKFNIKM